MGLPVLWQPLAPKRLHVSVEWDRYGRCETAICCHCGREIGVNIAGRMARHGPVNGSPCPGTDGETTFPGQGPGNAKRSVKAARAAMAGRPRHKSKR